MRDPDVFPDPDEFKPSRWLTADGELRDDIKQFDFGYGRRYDCAFVAQRLPALTSVPSQRLSW